MAPPDALSVIAALDRIAEATAADDGHAGLMRAVDEAAGRLLGHRLFTINAVHLASLEVERRYSNMPAVYPLAGRKKKRDTWWGRQVIEQMQPYLGDGEGAIRSAFADHELITGLGLDSVLNMPVCHARRCWGTMNLLQGGQPYDASQLPLARVLASTLLPVFLAPACE